MGELTPKRSVLQQAQRDVEEGKRRAAAVRAALTPEQLAAVEALESSVPARIAGWYMGPDNGKGRQRFIVIVDGEIL